MGAHDPLVAVVTPVYNGEKYLVECIESVLAQTYHNWEYTIVNNCSTDKTLEIAERYARMDRRIRIRSYNEFVGVIENHIRALRLISLESKYCKVVSADDWIGSDCLNQMVRVAEAHPTVVIVGSYQRCGDLVLWRGLPPTKECFSGREVSRLSLLSLGSPKTLEVFGTPTSALYRSDVIRKNDPFFPHLFPYADTTLYYEYLQYYDLGFVHNVHSSLRVHDEQETSRVSLKYNMHLVAAMEHISKYGPIYLNRGERESLKATFFRRYYKHLGACLLQLKWDRDYWTCHISKMNEIGYPFLFRKVIKGVLEKISEELQDPKFAFHKCVHVLQEKFFK